MMNTQQAQAIVDDIRRLYEVATPIDVIARSLHLPLRLVRHVIQHGQFPAEQLHWQTPLTQAGSECNIEPLRGRKPRFQSNKKSPSPAGTDDEQNSFVFGGSNRPNRDKIRIQTNDT